MHPIYMGQVYLFCSSPFCINILDNNLISNYNETMETTDIISLISKVRESANKFIIREMNRHGIKGLVPSHGDIIYSLLKSETLSMKDLAERIGKDKSTVTALVDKLIRLGYAQRTRDVNDSRVLFVTLTDQGKSLKPVFDSISADLFSVVYNDVSLSEQDDLLRILQKIYHNF